MLAQASLSSFAQPVPELPVRDVERAQAHYRDKFGFQIGWLYPGGEIGAVNRDNTAIFFRRRKTPFEPAIHWVYSPEIETAYEQMRALGANITEPLEKKPWGLTQFTVEDLDGNRFYFHRD
jgi:predicted enzyme related to lactoylglutathione lyase